ncbi:hypothetical protein JOD54_001968 [Actinokineospora baliensis]|uniref:PqqD family protein n=1 Tax=Actinokineospora baliensis TaxID=547056 RepID=UPI0019596C73|nr:PqqD family protein [Actinokineospora baliensis]MBM7771764.1 hypothetical protein [Actinokineospora baliensis]
MHFYPEPWVQATTLDSGELILIESRSGTMYQGNSTAGRMWQALVELNGDETAVSREVAAMFGIDADRARRDLLTWLDELVDLGIVRAE